MTRSVTIINTSNWENEDYIINRENKDEHVPMVLRPGESYQFTPNIGERITFGESNVKEARPFHTPCVIGGILTERQVLPKVTVKID